MYDISPRRRYTPHLSPGNFARLFFAVGPIAIFASICINEPAKAPQDILPTFGWLAFGLIITVTTLVPGIHAVHERTVYICDALHDLRSDVKNERVCLALDSAVDLLTDPTPDRLETVGGILRDLRAELTEPSGPSATVGN